MHALLWILLHAFVCSAVFAYAASIGAPAGWGRWRYLEGESSPDTGGLVLLYLTYNIKSD